MIRELIQDKVILLNAGAITVSFMDIEAILKIILLSASIIYTVIRIYHEIKTKTDDK
jgi:hypothetical protein